MEYDFISTWEDRVCTRWFFIGVTLVIVSMHLLLCECLTGVLSHILFSCIMLVGWHIIGRTVVFLGFNNNYVSVEFNDRKC